MPHLRSSEMDIMEYLFPVLYVFIIIITVTLVIVLSLWRYRNIKRLMEQQARKRSGTVVGTFLLPLLKFSYRALPVVVTSVPGSKYRHAKTEVNVTLLKPVPKDLIIQRESVRLRLGKALGAIDVQLDSDEFDREFLIKTQDEKFARNLVNYTLQNKLLELKQEKPRISLEGTWLIVQIPRVMKTEEEYDQLLALTFTIVDRIQEL
jgi:hypothetical protein